MVDKKLVDKQVKYLKKLDKEQLIQEALMWAKETFKLQDKVASLEDEIGYLKGEMNFKSDLNDYINEHY